MKYILNNGKTKDSANYLTDLIENRKVLVCQEELEAFLHPTSENLLNPYKLDNIEKCAHIILDSVANQEKILIIVDSDMDGYTSAAAMWNYLKMVDANCDLSYRLHDGKQHGLEDHMEYLLQEKRADLIIIPDAASNDGEYCKQLVETFGYKICIIDHHICNEYNDYSIIVNNQMSKDYFNKELTGASVVYKVLCVMDNISQLDYAHLFLDLAAFGMIGDMASVVPLENRYINEYGLSHITNPCLQALVEKQSFSIKDINKLTPNDVAFYITPLVNAMIRVGSSHEKDILFQSFIHGEDTVHSTKRGASPQDTETIAEQNARNCVNSRSRQNRERDRGIEQLEIQIFNNNLDENKIIVADASDLDVSTTLTGLIAMNLVAKYKKPVLLGRDNGDGVLRGSMRAPNGTELKDFRTFLLDSGYMEFVEGHPNAAGQSIKMNNIQNLINYVNQKLKDIDFKSGYYEVDYSLGGNSSNLAQLITDLSDGIELWGQGFLEPYIVIEDIPIYDYQVIGKNKDTLKFSFNGITYIKFKADDTIQQLIAQKGNYTITVVGRANVNEWNGQTSPQILIEDLNINEDYGF